MVPLSGASEEASGSGIFFVYREQADTVEKPKRDYWATLNDGQKVNCILTYEEDVQAYELDGGAWVLTIRIPRAEHYQKPIYLNGNPLQGTYNRRNEGDFHCTEAEVRQMMSDANLQRSTADARILRNFTKQSLSSHQAVTKPNEADSVSWHQVATKLSLSWKQVAPIMKMMQEERLAKELRMAMDMKDSTHFKKTILDPLLSENIIAMTSPDKPTSPNQMYFLTEKGKAILAFESKRLMQPSGVSDNKVERLIKELDEALPKYPIGLPEMADVYRESLPVTDVRCFQAAYKMRKEMFSEAGSWIYMTPELYLNEMQGNIWQHYNVQFLMHKAVACFTIRFSEIKDAFSRLALDGRYAVITSFNLGTFDSLYGGDVRFEETEFGYRYGDVTIYRVPSHEAHLIVMRKEHLPRCEAKMFEGENPEYALINERHLLYSNLFNMKEEGDGYGLAMMRDIKFCYPSEDDFCYIKLLVDRLEKAESEVDGLSGLNL